MGSIAYFNTYTLLHYLTTVLKNLQEPSFPDTLFLVSYSFPTFLYSTTTLPPEKKRKLGIKITFV